MLLGQVFERFVQESPVSVMVRGLLEKFLCPQKLDELFEQSAFVSVHSGTLILNGGRFDEPGRLRHSSIRACCALTAAAEEIGVSVTSVYNKLNGIEPLISAELVRETASQMEATIRHLKATLPDWLPGYRVKILDGNAIAATEHRMKELRQISSAPLPGKSLVVLDPAQDDWR